MLTAGLIWSTKIFPFGYKYDEVKMKYSILVNHLLPITYCIEDL